MTECVVASSKVSNTVIKSDGYGSASMMDSLGTVAGELSAGGSDSVVADDSSSK